VGEEGPPLHSYIIIPRRLVQHLPPKPLRHLSMRDYLDLFRCLNFEARLPSTCHLNIDSRLPSTCRLDLEHHDVSLCTVDVHDPSDSPACRLAGDNGRGAVHLETGFSSGSRTLLEDRAGVSKQFIHLRELPLFYRLHQSIDRTLLNASTHYVAVGIAVQLSTGAQHNHMSIFVHSRFSIIYPSNA
jgi:hypothetical protein